MSYYLLLVIYLRSYVTCFKEAEKKKRPVYIYLQPVTTKSFLSTFFYLTSYGFIFLYMAENIDLNVKFKELYFTWKPMNGFIFFFYYKC